MQVLTSACACKVRALPDWRRVEGAVLPSGPGAAGHHHHLLLALRLVGVAVVLLLLLCLVLALLLPIRLPL